MAFSPNAQTVYADGPAGSPQQPAKSEIRKLLKQYENVIDAFLSNGGLIFASKASLDASLAYAANTMAWVLGDANVANNGIYRKIGGSGSGSWVRVADLPFSFIIASDVGAGTANAIQATTSMPVSSSALIWTNIFEANTASPVTISFNGGTALTIKTNTGNNIAAGGLVAGMIVMGIVSGSTFRLVSDQASAAIVSAAEAAQAAAEAAAAAAVSLVGAAATAVQPPAIDLVTAMTSAGIQAVADVAAPNGRHVMIPMGDIGLSAALVTGDQAISIAGAGPRSTRLIADGPINAIEHGLSVQNYFATLDIRNMGISAAHAGAKIAIEAKFNRDSGGFKVEDVVFDAFGAGLEFDQYSKIHGGTFTHHSRIKARCSIGGTAKERAATTQLGFEFISENNADKFYVLTFDDVAVDANNIAYLFSILGGPGNSGSIEGVNYKNANGRTNIGPWAKINVPNVAAIWHPPYWTFDTCNWQGSGAWLHVDSAAEVYITKCDIRHDAAIPIEWNPDGTDNPSGAKSPTLNTLQFTNVKGLTIRDTTITALAGSAPDRMIYIGPGCDDVVLDGITLSYEGGTLAAGIYIHPSVTNLRWQNINWKNWPVGVPRIWDGTNEILGSIRGGSAGTVLRGPDGNTFGAWTGSSATVNYVVHDAAGTGFGPIVRASGPDTNVPLNLQAKNAAPVAALSPLRIPTFTVSTLPSAAIYAQCIIYVSNGTSNKRLGISDGTSWRWPDGAVVS